MGFGRSLVLIWQDWICAIDLLVVAKGAVLPLPKRNDPEHVLDCDLHLGEGRKSPW